MHAKPVAIASVFSFLLAAPAAAQEALNEILDEASPSVVSIRAYNPNGNTVGQGSGFVVSKDGLIVTTLHVVEPGAVVELKTADGEIVNADDIVAIDSEWDLALLKADGLDAEPLKLAREDTVEAGTAVFAIESPFGFNNVASEGEIVALHPHAGRKDLMQISNRITPGSSGGPVLNTKGEVLGVAQAVPGADRGVYAIPIAVVAELRDGMAENASVRELGEFSSEARRVRDALANVRPELEQQCEPQAISLIDTVISDAIASGVDIYNSGDHLGCYRVYEGAGYKMLFLLNDRCEVASALLGKAIREASTTVTPGAYDSVPAAQAWIMRIAFDSLLGDRGPPSRLGGRGDDEPPPDID
ncbi:MAG: S1C family serine protease [Gammaproteobacteria bacterium]